MPTHRPADVAFGRYDAPDLASPRCGRRSPGRELGGCERARPHPDRVPWRAIGLRCLGCQLGPDARRPILVKPDPSSTPRARGLGHLPHGARRLPRRGRSGPDAERNRFTCDAGDHWHHHLRVGLHGHRSPANLIHDAPQAPADRRLDHLIPLELGGAPRDPANLWPEPCTAVAADGTPAGARVKDRFENWLHDEVCSGVLSLVAAQQQIAGEWVTNWEAAGRP